MNDHTGSLLARADWVAGHPDQISPAELERLVVQLAAVVRDTHPADRLLNPDEGFAKAWTPDA